MTLEPPKEEEDGENNTIQVTSAHSSKGLEWDTVYILHFNNNNWPSRMRSKTTKKELTDKELRSYYEGIEEEKRLLYVAMTRAKQNLILTSALYSSPMLTYNNSNEEHIQEAPSILPKNLQHSVSEIFNQFHSGRQKQIKEGKTPQQIVANNIADLAQLFRK
jgi:superfamily I DNA/RNA helicase